VGLLVLCCGGAVAFAAGPHGSPPQGTVELDTRSEYSHLRVRRQGNVRTLLFVRENGTEAEQSAVNLKRPHELQLLYNRFMFTSYLFRPQQEQVLIVGLGGGSMLHFLRHYAPQLRVDVVEIDPAVVEIAAKYFGVHAAANVNLITADGFRYLQETENRYDVIYMDAFLKPAAETDATGLPLRMKTEQFYAALQRKLKPEGLVVFNLNRHKGVEADLRAIGEAFRQSYVFRPPSGNMVVVATTSTTGPLPMSLLHARARETDQRLKPTFSFVELLGWLAH
jgi:spermidine synthase